MPALIRDEFTGMPANQAYALRYPDRYRARVEVAKAIQRGDLTRAACEHCGQSADKSQAHHTDYSKPLEVQWLCAPCHKAEHDRLGWGRPTPTPVETRAEYEARIAAHNAWRAERKAFHHAAWLAKKQARAALKAKGATPLNAAPPPSPEHTTHSLLPRG